MTIGLKNLNRGIERDNEEAVIGTQLRVQGQATAARIGRQRLEDANRTVSIWFRQALQYFSAPQSLTR
jgi:hypothetical protein